MRTKASVESNRLIRTRAAAEYLGCSPWKVRVLVHKGELHIVEDEPGSPWRFDKNDLDAYIGRSKQNKAA